MMIEQIISLGEENRKVMGFSAEQIIISSKSHESFGSLRAAVQKSGLLESVKTIQIDSITKIEYNEKSETLITIHFEQNGKSKKDSIGLADQLYREPLAVELANLRGFQRSVSEESKTKALLMNLLGVGLIAVLTVGFRSLALDAQRGEVYEASGRRSGIKQLVVDTVTAIGPTGITIIGLLGFSYMIYVTYRRYNKPAAVITFS
jgi:hypothetical protein